MVPSCGLVYLWLQCSPFCNAIISDLLGRIVGVPRASIWRTMSRHQPRCVSVTALVTCRQLSSPVPQDLLIVAKFVSSVQANTRGVPATLDPIVGWPTGRTLLTAGESAMRTRRGGSVPPRVASVGVLRGAQVGY